MLYRCLEEIRKVYSRYNLYERREKVERGMQDYHWIKCMKLIELLKEAFSDD